MATTTDKIAYAAAGVPVSITFTALILCELLNVAFEIHKWSLWMVGAELYVHAHVP